MNACNVGPHAIVDPTSDVFVTRHKHVQDLRTPCSDRSDVLRVFRRDCEEWSTTHRRETRGEMPHSRASCRDVQVDAIGMRDATFVNRELPISKEGVPRGNKDVFTELRNILPNIRTRDLDILLDYERELSNTVSRYNKRIRCILQSTERVFGRIRGQRIGLLIDASDANLAHGRDGVLRTQLLQLLNEQLSQRNVQHMYLATYGTRTSSCWQDPIGVDEHAIEKAKDFVQEQVRPAGGSNLLGGIKHIFIHGRGLLDCVVIICGSRPDQNGQFIVDYTNQILAGSRLPRLHLVAYDCPDPWTNHFLIEWANARPDNVFHRYRAAVDASVYLSNEVAPLLRNLQAAQRKKSSKKNILNVI
ncbi:unnamed protein product [Dicrocoelium dendriticum]|nr:unnamed protein product [Dicrocoelium dendriticum]